MVECYIKSTECMIWKCSSLWQCLERKFTSSSATFVDKGRWAKFFQIHENDLALVLVCLSTLLSSHSHNSGSLTESLEVWMDDEFIQESFSDSLIREALPQTNVKLFLLLFPFWRSTFPGRRANSGKDVPSTHAPGDSCEILVSN